jgi:hypothetical protein
MTFKGTLTSVSSVEGEEVKKRIGKGTEVDTDKTAVLFA